MIQFTTVQTYVDTLAVHHYIHAEDAPVQRDMWKRGLRVYAGAVAQVGVDTGRMREGIEVNRGRDALGPYVEVVSTDPNTIMHHNGTRAHAIVPNKHKAMRFTKTGGAVFAHSVLHPGTRANPFLTDNLRRAV